MDHLLLDTCSSNVAATGSFHGVGPFIRCDTPTSSVLFDGNIPTLTGLDGDMWASQLLTLQTTNPANRDIPSDFTGTSNYTGLKRIELVMLNCLEWGIYQLRVLGSLQPQYYQVPEHG